MLFFFFLKLLWFFDIPLLCYYINLSLSIISCLSPRDIYLPVGIYSSFWELIRFESFETFVTLLAIFLLINHQSFVLFFEFLFLKIFERICCILSSMIKKFLAIFTTYIFTCIFTNIFTHFFSKRQKSIAFFQIFNL